MKIRYDKEADIVYIKFSDSQIAESDEEKPGIILDYDSEGGIVGIEVFSLDRYFAEPENSKEMKAGLDDIKAGRITYIDPENIWESIK